MKSSKGVDLRKHMEPKKGSPGALSSFPIQSRPALSINDLPESEKLKITKLAEKVLELNSHIEKLNHQNEQERVRHAQEIKSIHTTIEGQISIIEDRLKLKDGAIVKLQNKEQMITSMLALYQAKLKNMADICRLAGDNEEYNKKKVTQLQADIDHFHIIMQNQKKLIESFDSTKEQLEERMKLMETRSNKRIKTLEDMITEETDRRLRAEKMNLQQNSENIMLKAEVQQLQYQLQQMRATQTASADQDTLLPHLRKAHSTAASANSTPLVSSGVSHAPTLSSSSTLRKSQDSARDETNPFKKYGPYEEYSIFFNNSPVPTRKSTDRTQQPAKRSRTSGDDVSFDEDGFDDTEDVRNYIRYASSTSMGATPSPAPTPASNKVPFANHSTINRDMQADDSGSAPAASSMSDYSPSRAIISQAEELLRRSRNIQLFPAESATAADDTATPAGTAPTAAVMPFPDATMPALKQAVLEPTPSQKLPPHHNGDKVKTSQENRRKVTAETPPSILPPVFLRDSRDSLISSVGHADHESEHSDEDDEHDVDEEVDSSSDEDVDDENIADSDAGEGEEDEEEEEKSITVPAAPTNVSTNSKKKKAASLPPQHSSRDSDDLQTSLLSSASSKKKKTKVGGSKPSNRGDENPKSEGTTTSSSKPKAFYPMRPLSATTNTAAQESATSASDQGHKKKPKKVKNTADHTLSDSDVQLTTEYSKNGGGHDQNFPVVKAKIVKVKKPRKAVLNNSPSPAKEAVSSSSSSKKKQHLPQSFKQEISSSFLSHESKDAVSLLQLHQQSEKKEKDKEREKKTSLLVYSSTDSISYLPRPPPAVPRSAHKADNGHANSLILTSFGSTVKVPPAFATSKPAVSPTSKANNATKLTTKTKNNVSDKEKKRSSLSGKRPKQDQITHNSNKQRANISRLTAGKNERFDASLFDLVDALEEEDQQYKQRTADEDNDDDEDEDYEEESENSDEDSAT